PRLSCVHFLLFYHCSVPLRDLHSFPTRRSSDLSDAPEPPDHLHHRGQRVLRPDQGPVLADGRPGLEAEDRGRQRPAAHRHLRELDRKSTRLNSSHRTISYAVFCLKKKKKKRQKE